MILVLMGVAGSGKTEIGKRLSSALGWPFCDGDDFQPSENVQKMAGGQPLSDSDRAPWLAVLRRLITEQIRKGENAIVACSALKKAYRDVLRNGDEQVHFIYLKGDFDTLNERLKSREGHFMKANMLASQLQTLEEPERALTIDVRRSPDEIIALIIQELKL